MAFNPDWTKLVPNIRGEMVKPNCWTKEITPTGKTVYAMRHISLADVDLINEDGYTRACRNVIVAINWHSSLRVAW